jgi:dipeptidyl aminopeptidase/acylaminoacyl peptidase
VGGRTPLLIAVAAVALLGAGEARAWSLEEVLARPESSSLTAADGVDRIAWVETASGARSVWTAAAPDFEPRLLVTYERDDGQPVGSLQLTADGSVLVWVRGSAPNSAGETANPDSAPSGVERAIWAIDTAGGEPRKIAVGGGPVLMPDGAHLVHASGGKVFERPLSPPEESDEDPEAAPAGPLFSARGQIGGLTPDAEGGRIAFVSNRGDHSFVGVFHREEQSITWMAPSVDRDSSPAWSPDGSSLAFLRAPGMRIGQRFDLTLAEPFAIWIGDPATGRAREAWASAGPDGGFAQFYVQEPLAWSDDGRLVFTSEEGGFHHAFSLDPESGVATNLTPGPFEIESFALAPDGGSVYFWGNHGDVDRRHVWSVPTAGGEPAALTAGEGIEVGPVPLASGERIALRHGDARRPLTVGVMPAGGGPIRTVGSAPGANFPAAELVEPQQVVFEAADGVAVHGQLFLPPNAEGPRPAVIFMHGGPIRQMLLGWHYSGYYANSYAFNQYLASRGYVVLAVNFRAGIGYGRDFRLAHDQGPRGASEYQDIVAAGQFLAARPDVDADRIGLWGGSYGGLLTAMGLARDSDLFAAGVDLHGVHDWAFRGSDFPLPGGAWGLTDADAELAFASSPVADVDSWRSPVLFVHGDDDRNVMFIQTTDLVRRLRDRDVHVETLVFPDEVHGFLRYASWLRTFEEAADFFDRFLGDQAATQ